MSEATAMEEAKEVVAEHRHFDPTLTANQVNRGKEQGRILIAACTIEILKNKKQKKKKLTI